MSLALWLVAIATVLLVLRALVAPLAPRRAVKAALFPGVLLAIGARSIAGALAQAPLKAVNFPWRTGAPVEHDRPALPVLGPGFLSLVPVIAAAAATLLARALVAPQLAVALDLPEIRPDAGALAALGAVSWEVLRGAAAALGEPARLFDPHVALFAWLALSFLVYAAPGYEEWKWVAGSAAALALAAGALEWLGLGAGFLSRGWFVALFYGDAVLEAIALLLAASLLTLALAAALRGGVAFLRAAIAPRAGNRPRER